MKEINESTTIKEFMEWFVSEYNGDYLPSDFDHTLDRLEGYRLAKKDSEENYIFNSAVELLRNSQNFFRIIKQYSNWKYRELS